MRPRQYFGLLSRKELRITFGSTSEKGNTSPEVTGGNRRIKFLHVVELHDWHT